MKKEKSCGAIIFNNNDEVLLVKHNTGHWDFPKGHMEKGETEIDTAIREVKEETNINVKLLTEYRYSITYNPKENVEKEVVYFLAKNISNKLIKQDKEIENIGWFKHNEALKTFTYDDARELYKKAYKDYIKIR